MRTDLLKALWDIHDMSVARTDYALALDALRCIQNEANFYAPPLGSHAEMAATKMRPKRKKGGA